MDLKWDEPALPVFVELVDLCAEYVWVVVLLNGSGRLLLWLLVLFLLVDYG